MRRMMPDNAERARMTIYVDRELLRKIDEAAGDVPRTRWITRRLEEAVGKPQPLRVTGRRVVRDA